MKLDPLLGTDADDYRAATEAWLRGHLTRAECDAALNDALATTGEPHHTWARRGYWTDEDGAQRTGGVHISATYAGHRGAFRVTVVPVAPGEAR